MPPVLPPYYFRIRENGAAVFRVDTENRQNRLDLVQIAVVNVRNGEVKPHKGAELTPQDKAAIADWLDRRRAILATREADGVAQTLDRINLTAQWAQAKASDEELEAVTDDLLLAIHDLRSVLVRRKADRAARARGAEDGSGGDG